MPDRHPHIQSQTARRTTLFLCGDVMLGRGIDQILRHPGDARLYEPVVTSAKTYVELAERVNGPIPRRADDSYVWGDVLDTLRRAAPDLRIINLETAITGSRQAAAKDIHYKMSPENVGCVTGAGIDCCVLANNHVLDWGTRGLVDTLDALRDAGICACGAGHDEAEARAPAMLEVPGKCRVLVFAFGSVTSGIPRSWAATGESAGVNLLPDLSERTVRRIAEGVREVRRPGDVVLVSIHWGGNWGYGIPPAHSGFAHRLVDRAGVDVVHGHSSHHPKAVEIYRDRLILYGCGDFLNDYEGIPGHDEFRGELAVMYLPTLDVDGGRLVDLRLIPFRINRFRLARAPLEDAAWLCDRLARESARFGVRIESGDDGALSATCA